MYLRKNHRFGGRPGALVTFPPPLNSCLFYTPDFCESGWTTTVTRPHVGRPLPYKNGLDPAELSRSVVDCFIVTLNVTNALLFSHLCYFLAKQRFITILKSNIFILLLRRHDDIDLKSACRRGCAMLIYNKR